MSGWPRWMWPRRPGWCACAPRTWVYGGLRVAGGQAVTMCAPSRNSACYQDFLQLEEQANPEGTIYVVTGNLSRHGLDSRSGNPVEVGAPCRQPLDTTCANVSRTPSVPQADHSG